MELEVGQRFFSEYPTLPQALRQIGELSDSSYQILLDSVRGEDAFNRSAERCRALAAELDSNLTAREVFMILGGLAFIYDSLLQGEPIEDKSFNDFVEFSGLGEVWDKNQNAVGYVRVAGLVRRNAELDRKRENLWLETGVADLAVDFDAFVDLRPRFSSDFKIEELVPVVMFRVAVETDNGPGKAYVFQINMAGIKELKDVVDDVQSQIDSIKNDSVLGPRVVTEFPMED